jgi:hypothetical protein
MSEMRLPDQGDPVDEAALRAELTPVDSIGLEGVPVDHQLPARSGPSHGPSTDGALDPEAARLGILETRSRMSETIDQIEEQLLRRKERLQARLDLRGQLRDQLAPAREVVEARPLAVLGGAVLLGAVVGYLTGGGEDGRGLDEPGPENRQEWRRRARRWESRSRELMRLNAELDEEVRRLRADLGDGADDESGGGWLSGVAGAVGAMLGRRATRTVVQLEEEDLPGDYHPSVSYDHFAHRQRTREPDDPLQG